MTEEREVLLGGLPADTPEYRAILVSLGLPLIPDLLPIPYKGSALEVCTVCSIPVWVGPELQKQRKALVKASMKHTTVCLLCASAIALDAEETNVISLTNKRPGQ